MSVSRRPTAASSGSAAARNNPPQTPSPMANGIYKFQRTAASPGRNMGTHQDVFRSAAIAIHPKKPRHRLRRARSAGCTAPIPRRGLFKTTDGGKTWDKIPFITMTARGVIDIAMHPTEPDTLPRRDVGTQSAMASIPSTAPASSRATTAMTPIEKWGEAGGDLQDLGRRQRASRS